MNRTSICLFGTCPVRVCGVPYYLGISRATEMLFNYLLLNFGKEARREFLAELIWRGSSRVRKRSALNSAVWRIKRQIKDVGGIDLICSGPAIILDIATEIQIDARELTEIVRSTSLHEPIVD